jgi:SAM-dependent methyltransferase
MAPHSPYRRALDRSVIEEAQMLLFFAQPDDVLLEIGSGDLSLSREMARRVKTVIAADITDAYHTSHPVPDNLRVLITDGISLDLEPETIDVAYSNQLLEHFHPDDAEEHIRNVNKALKAGSAYICVTPHRYAGPHDISKYFDRTATGLHIKEYTIAEVTRLFRRNGFHKIRVLFSIRYRYLQIPAALASALELMLAPFPYSYRKFLVGTRQLQRLFGMRVLAVKI